MCGIAGILRVYQSEQGPPPPHPESIPERWLDVLDDSIKHRGPDGHARFRDRAVREDGATVDVAFVHRRLSIIDHSGGHQPMVHDGDRPRPDLTYRSDGAPKLAHELSPVGERPDLVAVVFNGCVYNHRDLRCELEEQGADFSTDHSDTETLIHGWRAWRAAYISRVDAMLAAATWDRRGACLCLARDAFGEKPLYLVEQGGALAFASAATPLAKLQATDPGCFGPPRPAESSRLSAWIQYGWSTRTTPISGVETQPPGTAVVRGSDKTTTDAAWPRDVLDRSREDLTPGQVDQSLRAAVHSRLEADVPVGCFLSGGIDSGLVARYASEASPDIGTFTVRMPDDGYDESHAAERTARHLGARHTVLDCDPEPAGDLVRIIEELGLPFGDSSLLPALWVSRAAARHVRVALAGDGGDELFLGYDRQRAIPLLAKLARTPAAARRTAASLAAGGRSPKTRLTRIKRLLDAALGGGYQELVAIFPTPLLSELGARASEIARQNQTIASDAETAETAARRFDLLCYLPEDLLRKTDTASMSAPLEVRAPFLDRRVAEPALSAPRTVLMPRGQRKGLLKQVARRYLPSEIVDRPKQGFAIPIGDWFRTDFGSMRQLLYDHLESADPFPGLADAGVGIEMSVVRRMLQEHDAAAGPSVNPWRGRDHSQRLYMLLVLSIWAKWLASLRR